VHIPWREMSKNGIAELLNLCYGFNRPVTRTFPVSVSLRASLAKVAKRRRSQP
jgi:LacI family transcriptional regulator